MTKSQWLRAAFGLADSRQISSTRSWRERTGSRRRKASRSPRAALLELLENRVLLSSISLVHDTGDPTDRFTSDPTVIFDTSSASGSPVHVEFRWKKLNDPASEGVEGFFPVGGEDDLNAVSHPHMANWDPLVPIDENTNWYGLYEVEVWGHETSGKTDPIQRFDLFEFWWIQGEEGLPTLSSETIVKSIPEGTHIGLLVDTITIETEPPPETGPPQFPPIGDLFLSIGPDTDGVASPSGYETQEYYGFSLVQTSVTTTTRTYDLRFTGTLDYEGSGAEADHRRDFDLVVNSTSGSVVPGQVTADVTVNITNVTPTATAALSIVGSTANLSWTMTPGLPDALFHYSLQRQVGGPFGGWTTAFSGTNVTTLSTSHNLGTNYGTYRLVVNGTWTAAGGNDYSNEAIATAVYVEPPNTPPVVNAQNQSVTIESCGTLFDPIDVSLASWISDDFTDLADMLVTVSVISSSPADATPPTVSIVNLWTGSDWVKHLRIVPSAGGAGASSASVFTVQIQATDSGGLSDSDAFTISISNTIPNPGTPTMTAPTESVHIIPENESTKSVTVSWTAGSNTVSFDWELTQWIVATDGVSLVRQLVDSGNTAGTSDTRSYFPGDYEFWVRGENCVGEVSAWASVGFTVMHEISILLNDSYENECGCSSLAPGYSVGSATITNGAGDLAVSSVMASTIAGPLGAFMFPTFLSDSNPHPVMTVRVPLASVPNSAQIQLFAPGTSTLIAQSPTLTSATLGMSAFGKYVDIPVRVDATAYATGTVYFDVKLNLNTNGSAPAVRSITRTNQAMAVQNNLASNYGRRFSMAAVDRLDIETGTVRLLRGGGTSTAFSGDTSSGFSTPVGSFSGMTYASGSYTVTNAGGAKRVFNSSGYMTSIISPEGEEISLAWADLDGDSSELELQYVTHVPSGSVVQHHYSGGQLTHVSYDPDGAGSAPSVSWDYSFSTSNNLLESITGPASGVSGEERPQVNFIYLTGSWLLDTMEKSDTATSGAVSEKIKFEYDTYNNVSKVTLLGDTMPDTTPSDDRVWTFSSAESLRLSGSGASIEGQIVMDTITLPAVSSDAGPATVKRQVDRYGNVLYEERTIVGNVANTLKVRYERNDDGQITKLVGPWYGNDVPLETTYSYTDKLLTRVDHPDGTFESWTYATTNPHPSRPLTWTDRAGRTATYAYSGQGMLLSTVITAPNTQLIASTYRTWSGNLLKTEVLPNPNGITSGTTRPAVEYYYDSQSRLIHTRYTIASGSGGSWTLAGPATTDVWVSQGYDAAGNLSWITDRYHPTSLDSNSLPASSPVSVRTDLEYDDRGNVRSMTLPDPDNTDGLNRPVYEFVLDAWDRQIAVITPGDQTAELRTTDFTWNRFGELSSTSAPDPDGAGSLTATTTTLTYDKRGHVSLMTISDTTGDLTKVFYQYDSAGRLRWESLPLSGSVSASLEREQTFYQHDALGRVTLVETPDALVAGITKSWQKTKFTYDDVIRRVSLRQYVTGDASVLSEMWFDPLGRLTATISPSPDNTGTGNPPLIESYTYFDGNTTYGSRGTMVKKVDPRGDITWMKFGPLGDLLVTEMSDPDGTGPLQTSFQILNYDLMGALNSETQSHGTFGSQSGIRTTSYLRNVRGEVTRTMTPDPDGAGALLPLLELREYDNLGRLTTITDAYVSSFDGGGQPVPTKIASTVYAYGTDGLISEERRLDRNDTEDRTIGYLCKGPAGNYFSGS